VSGLSDRFAIGGGPAARAFSQRRRPSRGAFSPTATQRRGAFLGVLCIPPSGWPPPGRLRTPVRPFQNHAASLRRRWVVPRRAAVSPLENPLRWGCPSATRRRGVFMEGLPSHPSGWPPPGRLRTPVALSRTTPRRCVAAGWFRAAPPCRRWKTRSAGRAHQRRPSGESLFPSATRRRGVFKEGLPSHPSAWPPPGRLRTPVALSRTTPRRCVAAGWFRDAPPCRRWKTRSAGAAHQRRGDAAF
jgi:hypothetical protein